MDVPEDYTVFVHLLDENGVLIAQHDGVPLSGMRPTSTWTKGERLLDLHEFRIPAEITATTGQLITGMYQTESLDRQIFSNDRDVIPIGSIRFEKSNE